MEGGAGGTLAAFAELRIRLLWRRLRGRAGVPELVSRVVIWLVVLPLGFAFAGATGFAAWRGVRIGSGLETTLAASTLLFGTWTAWTAMALTVTEREAVDLARFLIYPVPPWKISAYSLLASVVGDPFAFFWCQMLLGAFVGAAVARPGPWLFLLALAFLLFVVATVALVAVLQELLARFLRKRGAKEVGIAAIYAGLAGLIGWATTSHRTVFEAFRRVGSLRWVLAPPALAEGAVTALYIGRPAASLPWLAGLAGAAFGLAFLAHRLALADALSGRGGENSVAANGASAWHLPGRFGILLEKEGKYLLRNPLAGVLALVVPSVAAVVAWKIVPHLPDEAGDAIRVLPLVAFAMYAHLVSEVFYLNAFGWERGGARIYFLAPLRLEGVLLAKNLVAYSFSFVLFLTSFLLVSSVGGKAPSFAFPAALALHAGMAPYLAGAGNFVSVLNPKVIPFNVQRGGSLSPLSALAGVALISGVSALFAVPVLVALRLESPSFLVAAWSALGFVGAVAYRYSLPRAAALLRARKEAFLDAIAGDDA